MKNLWPEEFNENDKISAKNFIEEQAKLLPKLTNSLVYAAVEENKFADSLIVMKNEFIYEFYIYGKFLEGYRFKVLTFSHDITLYPVKFLLDELIAKELSVKKEAFGYFKVVTDINELENLISSILTCDRMKNVIGSILKLSR
jgi:hypothetical protein